MTNWVTHVEKKGMDKEECQDVFFMVHQNHGMILCLADAVSGARYGKEGAAAVVRAVSDRLTACMTEKSLTEEKLKIKIYGAVKNTLAELSKSKNCSKKEFASTLILVMFPPEGEDVWFAHIGDGMIFQVEESGKTEIISYPHYGILKNYTYTTASSGLHRWIRVGKKKNTGDLLGMTDGLAEEIMEKMENIKPEYAIMIKNRDWTGLEDRIREKQWPDDTSFFAVHINGKGGQDHE